MRATLEFNLEDEFDLRYHKMAIHATDAYLVIDRMHERLGYIFNHSEDDAEVSFANKLLTELNDLMDRYGISLNDLP